MICWMSRSEAISYRVIKNLLLLTYILPDLAAQSFVNTRHGLVDRLEEALDINKIR